MRVVIPGDFVDVDEEGESSRIVLGPGLVREGSRIGVCKPGVLRRKNLERTPVMWVDTPAKRYVAVRGENVIGVVLAKAGDTFRVDIGTAEPASLSYLAFEGATKKNRPNVQPGDVLYAKLVAASKDTEPELVCVDSHGKKAGLGVLSGSGGGGDREEPGSSSSSSSWLFSVPLHLVRKMLAKDCALLPALGKRLPFEIAVGMNGRVWIRSRKVSDTICVANAIQVAEHMTNAEIDRMCAKLLDAMQ